MAKVMVDAFNAAMAEARASVARWDWSRRHDSFELVKTFFNRDRALDDHQRMTAMAAAAVAAAHGGGL